MAVSPTKQLEGSRYWVVDSGWPKEPCIRCHPDPPKRRGNFGCKRHNTAELRPMQALGCNAPWIRFLIFFALYILFACLCCMLPRLFLTYLLPYLSFLLRIDPLHFEARSCRRWLNLALVFLCYSTFLWIGECMLDVVFFLYQAKKLAWWNVSEMACLCQVGCKTTIRSVCSCRTSGGSTLQQKCSYRMDSPPLGWQARGHCDFLP